MNNRGRLLVPLLLCLGGNSRCVGASIPIVNPSFEALTGTDLNHFDGAGRLRDNHYSVMPGYPVEATGFQSADAIPGWQTIASAGTYNPPSRLVPLGAPLDYNVAWINVTGVLRQTLAATFQPNTTYQLTVEVGSLQGFEFPGYEVGLFAAGKVVVANTGMSAPAFAGSSAQSVFLHGLARILRVSDNLSKSAWGFRAGERGKWILIGSDCRQWRFPNRQVASCSPVVSCSCCWAAGAGSANEPTRERGPHRLTLGFCVRP